MGLGITIESLAESVSGLVGFGFWVPPSLDIPLSREQQAACEIKGPLWTSQIWVSSQGHAKQNYNIDKYALYCLVRRYATLPGDSWVAIYAHPILS